MFENPTNLKVTLHLTRHRLWSYTCLTLDKYSAIKQARDAAQRIEGVFAYEILNETTQVLA